MVKAKIDVPWSAKVGDVDISFHGTTLLFHVDKMRHSFLEFQGVQLDELLQTLKMLDGLADAGIEDRERHW
jgi:hypothetical protein